MCWKNEISPKKCNSKKVLLCNLWHCHQCYNCSSLFSNCYNCSKNSNVLHRLAEIAEYSVKMTGFFQSGQKLYCNEVRPHARYVCENHYGVSQFWQWKKSNDISCGKFTKKWGVLDYLKVSTSGNKRGYRRLYSFATSMYFLICWNTEKLPVCEENSVHAGQITFFAV